MMQDEEAAHIGAEDVEVIYMTEMIADDGLLSEVLHMVSSVFERQQSDWSSAEGLKELSAQNPKTPFIFLYFKNKNIF